MHLGIDVGTGSTVAVLKSAGGRVTPLLFDGSPLLPSAVHLDVAEGVLAVGAAAVRGGAGDPDRFEPHPKSHAAAESVPLGGMDVPVVHLFAAILWAVHAEALRVTGGAALREVALTHPASWGAHARGALLAAASMAGLPAARLVPSPVALAGALAGRLPVTSGRSFITYELGAAIFEVAVVQPSADGPRIVASAGLAGAGGLDLDAAIATHLLAATPGAPGTSGGSSAAPGGGSGAWRGLLDQARRAKELLSTGVPVTVRVAGGVDVTLTPADLERIATPLLRPTAELTLRTMRAAGVDETSVEGVHLAGGATLLPLVATLLHRATGIEPVAADHPKLAAAEGSLAVLSGFPRQAAAPAPPPATPRQSGGDGAHLWRWLPDPWTLVAADVWRDAPFHPLHLGLPSGSGWTIRARFTEPERTVFLARAGGPLLFRSVEGLTEYLLTDDTHELAAVPGWDAARERFVTLVSHPGDEDLIDLDLVQYNLGFPPQQWLPDLLIGARDVAVELAEEFDLHDISALLAPGTLLDTVDDLLRAADQPFTARSSRRRLATVDADTVRSTWHAIATRLDGVAAWSD
ncbi:Hsp70 family protein [Dactylosporangium sp. NPDC000521]|uniref:Hsp70 family protein n=1 Tax=Dactylosporangium sp. NPDC000521 TaxID=3363975 RepID=UPI0036CF9CDA